MTTVRQDVDWASLQKAIVDWWQPQEHDFPWRRPDMPEWMSLVTEVLLQRTRASAVASLHPVFFERFPAPSAIAAATEAELTDSIYGLGLLWRAKYLHQLGEALSMMDDEVPERRADIEALPGVGPYAAGAFIALHRNQAATFVDANVVRLLARYVGFTADGETRRKAWFLALVDRLFDHPYEPSIFGYALLDFTRDICGSRPLHEQCPLIVRGACALWMRDAHPTVSR